MKKETTQPISRVDLKRADLGELVAADPVLASAPVVKALGKGPFAQGRLRRFADQAVVVQQSEEGDSLLIVMNGAVRLFARKDRDSAELGTANRGDVIGEGEALSGGARKCSAVAQGQVDVIELPRVALMTGTTMAPALATVLQSVHAQRMKALDEMNDFLNRW